MTEKPRNRETALIRLKSLSVPPMVEEGPIFSWMDAINKDLTSLENQVRELQEGLERVKKWIPDFAEERRVIARLEKTVDDLKYRLEDMERRHEI